eukprot:scaffold2429_cov106-Cylindrotheca_fusiformis.AAC.1
MEIDEAENYEYNSLSAVQKNALAILPIPSALLSVLGSSIIIYMALVSRKEKRWTPYNRLLVAMSICDIVSSITLGMAAFFYPKETSNKAWAFGNDASCSAIGFLNQVSFSGMLYNAMLSWVKRWPKLCGDGPNGTGEPCKSHYVAWVFGGWIGLSVLGALLVNNFIIWKFVRNQTKKRKKHARHRLPDSRDDSGSVEDDEEHLSPTTIESDSDVISIASSLRTAVVAEPLRQPSGKHLLDRRSQQNQNRRLELVRSQALLFVGCFVISNFWSYLLRLFEAQATEYVDEMELPYHNYHFVVLQAIFLPLQGFFNMMVYIRPKYLKNRSDFPRETRIWAIRRSIFGSSVDPLRSSLEPPKAVEKKILNVKRAKRKENFSSMTMNSNGPKPKINNRSRCSLDNSLDAIKEGSRGESESRSFPFQAEAQNVITFRGETQDADGDGSLAKKTHDIDQLPEMNPSPLYSQTDSQKDEERTKESKMGSATPATASEELSESHAEELHMMNSSSPDSTPLERRSSGIGSTRRKIQEEDPSPRPETSHSLNTEGSPPGIDCMPFDRSNSLTGKSLSPRSRDRDIGRSAGWNSSVDSVVFESPSGHKFPPAFVYDYSSEKYHSPGSSTMIKMDGSLTVSPGDKKPGNGGQIYNS